MTQDPSKSIIALPLIDVDKVIFTQRWTFTVANTIGATSQPVFNTDPTIISSPGLIPIGIYSFDGGTTWNRFLLQTSVAVNLGLAVNVGMVGYSNGNLTIQTDVFATVGAGSTIPIEVRFGLLEPTADQTYLLPPGFYYNQNFSLDSRNPVPKFAFRDKVPVDGQVHVVHHGLGYIPDVLVYDWTQIFVSRLSENGATSNTPYFVVDEQNLTFTTIDLRTLASDPTLCYGYNIYFKDTN